MITPLCWHDDYKDAEGINEDSVDLRLGCDFFVLRSDRLFAHIPGVTLGYEFQRPVHIPLGRYIVLPGHQTVLAATLEYIKLPPTLSAMVLTKSSWARSFITIETAPWVHPNWRGCLTLEIANHSEVAFILYPGYAVAQLILFQVDHAGEPVEEPSRRYLGATRPEPPDINEPRIALRELGISKDQIQSPPGYAMSCRRCDVALEKVDSTMAEADPTCSTPGEDWIPDVRKHITKWKDVEVYTCPRCRRVEFVVDGIGQA
ncbi:MAG: hypothetical protein IH830_02115 [Planctomycetes bacterium]|nr:hypothetical protein [Planctomycetota bacterium]